jgi:hypothetical protein
VSVTGIDLWKLWFRWFSRKKNPDIKLLTLNYVCPRFSHNVCIGICGISGLTGCEEVGC